MLSFRILYFCLVMCLCCVVLIRDIMFFDWWVCIFVSFINVNFGIRIF